MALSKSGSWNTQHVLLSESLQAKPSPGTSASINMVGKQRSRQLGSKSFRGLFRAAECFQIHGTGWDIPGITEVVGWNDGETHLRKFMLIRGGSCWLEKKPTPHPSLKGKKEEENYSILTVKLMKSRLDEWEIFNPDSSPVFSVEKGCWETGEKQKEDYHWPET